MVHSPWAAAMEAKLLATAFLDHEVDGEVILKLSGRSYRSHRARPVLETSRTDRTCRSLKRRSRPPLPIPTEDPASGLETTTTLSSLLIEIRVELMADSLISVGDDDDALLTSHPQRPQTIRPATTEVVPTGPKKWCPF